MTRRSKSPKTLKGFWVAWLWWKIIFFHIFNLGNIGQENLFYDILEQRNAFLGYKNKQFKKSKNWDFSKGVNPRFRSKTGFFPSFSFRSYRTKKAFQGERRRITEICSKGLVHGFRQKLSLFPNFLF